MARQLLRALREEVGMDAVMFSIKRAFHKSIEAGLRLTRVFGLTPARFDLLYALHFHGRDATRQCWLRALLGVSAPTVSRMVSSLERLGLVARLRDTNGRSCGVKLTKAGRRCIGGAIRELIARGAARRMVTAFWPPYPFHNGPAAAAENKATLRELVYALGRMRRTLKDRARFEYSTLVPRSRPEVGPPWGGWR